MKLNKEFKEFHKNIKVVYSCELIEKKEDVRK